VYEPPAVNPETVTEVAVEPEMVTVFETVIEPLRYAVTTWLVIALPPFEP
jgi:hypothetical protein